MGYLVAVGNSRSEPKIKTIYSSNSRTICAGLISVIFRSSVTGNNWRFLSNPCYYYPCYHLYSVYLQLYTRNKPCL